MAKVDLDGFTPNSDRARANVDSPPETAEDTELVEYTPMKKRNILSRIFDVLGINTDIKGTVESVWEDVIVPSFLDGCRDSIYTAADYIFGGNISRRPRSTGSKSKNKNYTPYGDVSKKNSNTRVKQPSQKAYYLEWDDRDRALEVKATLEDVFNQIGRVTIADLLAADGKTTSNYTLQYWGWYDISKVQVRTTSNRKYYLSLPNPVIIEEER